MKKFAILTACLIAFGAHAQASGDWMRVAATKDATWDAKNKSGHVIENSEGTALAVVTRMRRKGKTMYTVTQVTMRDCTNGYGTLRDFDMSGRPSYQNDFAIPGETAADQMARVYCGILMILTADGS